MSVTCVPDPELKAAILVKPIGLLDVEGATHFWEVVSPRLSEEASLVLVDMNGVDLMTSAGISVLIRVLSRVQLLNGDVSLFGCNDAVRRVLRITELESLLKMCETAEEARARMS